MIFMNRETLCCRKIPIVDGNLDLRRIKLRLCDYSSRVFFFFSAARLVDSASTIGHFGILRNYEKPRNLKFFFSLSLIFIRHLRAPHTQERAIEKGKKVGGDPALKFYGAVKYKRISVVKNFENPLFTGTCTDRNYVQAGDSSNFTLETLTRHGCDSSLRTHKFFKRK